MSDTEYKAPPEDSEALARTFRPPSEEELEKARRAREEHLRLFNLGARQRPEELALALAVRNEAELRILYEHSPSPAIAAQLAEALWRQGRYAEAAEVYPARRELALAMVEAEERPEAERCECPNRTVEEQGRHVEVPRDYIVERVWRHSRGEFGWLLRCNTCGQLNITSVLPEEVVAFHERRQR